MDDDPASIEPLRRIPTPVNLFVGTGTARPVSVRNVIAFARMKAVELGARKSLHNRFVLCLNLHRSASIEMVLNEVALRLSPSRYILFAPHQLHTYTGLDEREIAILFVTFESDDTNLLYHLCHRVMELTPFVRKATADFVGVHTGDHSARRDNHVVLATETLIEAIIGNDRDSSMEAHIPLPAVLKDALQKLNGAQAMTVLSVARDCGISEAYLRKLFKKQMGIPLGQYLSKLRQNKAHSLLGASDESISRIAELCGYKSVYAFSRSFHLYNDCTPSAYRERIRNKDHP